MPDITLDLTLFATAFVTVLVIMDPIGNIPIFLALTKGQTVPQRRRAAALSSTVAGTVILAFAIGGQQVLHLLGISLESLQVAGGLLLLVIALELLHPSSGGASSLASGDTNIALVPLGTPLLAGPGAIAATMLYTRQADDLGGSLSVVFALVAVLGVIYSSMRYASLFAKVLRDNGIELLSRVMGLLVAAIAVQLVARAVEAWISHGVA
ncbi:MAG: MarC family protein [Acidimicrobiales bacterium]